MINTVIEGDCLDVMKSMPDKCVDLVLTDPPYGIGEDGGRFRDRKGGGHRVLPCGGWDNECPTKEVFDEIIRISKNQIIWGGNYFSDKLPVSRGWLYWKKLMGGDFSDGELAWTSIDMVIRDFVFCNKYAGRIHPAQKPVELFLWCLDFLPQADTILDCYAGSGTTAVACLRTKRNYILIEKEPKYVEICKARIAQAETGVSVKEQKAGQKALWV